MKNISVDGRVPFLKHSHCFPKRDAVLAQISVSLRVVPLEAEILHTRCS